MREFRYCLVVLLAVASQAAAETAPAPTGGAGPLSKCDAFKKQADGSWIPTRDVNIELPDKTVITVGSAASFTPGKATLGPDVGSVIERECGSR